MLDEELTKVLDLLKDIPPIVPRIVTYGALTMRPMSGFNSFHVYIENGNQTQHIDVNFYGIIISNTYTGDLNGGDIGGCSYYDTKGLNAYLLGLMNPMIHKELFEQPTHLTSKGVLFVEGYNAALKEAASICEKMVIGGRAWTEEQQIAANALFAASENIKKLKK